LEDPCDKKIVEVIPHNTDLISEISIDFPPTFIPTFIVLPLSSLLHSSMDPLMSILLKPGTCVIDAPNLDQSHHCNVTVGL